jgi:hypothetical protein
MLMFGEDFSFQNAHLNYKNMDAMIAYMNANHGDQYFFKYSTPGTYIDAIAKQNIEWPTRYDDLFPYANDWISYWTGYFTTRPNMKAHVRRASSLLQAQT